MKNLKDTKNSDLSNQIIKKLVTSITQLFFVVLVLIATTPFSSNAQQVSLFQTGHYMPAFDPAYFTSKASLYVELTDAQSDHISGFSDFYFAPLAIARAKEKNGSDSSLLLIEA